MQFTTIDVDNDLASWGSCVVGDKYGGWWFNACADVNLNGLYGTVSSHSAIYWLYWEDYAPMKTTSMMAKCHP